MVMKVIIGLFILIQTIPMFSQVGEVEVKPEAILVGKVGKSKLSYPKLEYIDTELGRYFTLTYLNAEYDNQIDLKGTSFIGTNEDLDYVYEFLKAGYGNSEDRSLKVGKDDIKTSKTVSKNSIMVFIHHHDSNMGYFYLTLKHLDLLFGKTQ